TAVVLGRTDQPGRMGVKNFFQTHHVAWRASGLKVGVVERDVEVGQFDVGDLPAFGGGHVGDRAGEAAVPGLGACAARKNEERKGCVHDRIVGHGAAALLG